MKKLYVCSDLHSHFTPFKEALDKAGFDENNPDHIFISCGDAFDRGDESEKLFKWLMSIERKILIKGNHDILLDECCMREFPYSYDKHNGTIRTIQDISGKQSAYDFAQACCITYDRLSKYRELLVNYFETKNYIFVHSWIPTYKQSKPNLTDKLIPLTADEWMEDWRNATDVQWGEAMWGNPFLKASQDLNKTGKTIVFGHWHCSTGHKMLGNCNDEFNYAIWEPCYFKNTIGIDRCTAYTGEVNVLVLEDDFIEG